MVEIRLNHRIDEQKMDVLKYGLSYYKWVKSRRRNCYYLFFSPKATQAKYKLIAGLVMMLVAVLSFGWFGDHWFSWLAAGGFLGISSLLALHFFLKSAKRIAKQIPPGAVMVADLERSILTVRNDAKLPFVQTPVPRLSVPLHRIRTVECRSAYKIELNGIWRRDLVGNVPTWSALYVTYGSGDDPAAQPELWLVGAKIPESMYVFFVTVLKINIAEIRDFSRFDK